MTRLQVGLGDGVGDGPVEVGGAEVGRPVGPVDGAPGRLPVGLVPGAVVGGGAVEADGDAVVAEGEALGLGRALGVALGLADVAGPEAVGELPAAPVGVGRAGSETAVGTVEPSAPPVASTATPSPASTSTTADTTSTPLRGLGRAATRRLPRGPAGPAGGGGTAAGSSSVGASASGPYGAAAATVEARPHPGQDRAPLR
ncbi:hypothetical protein [Kitasatospora sp. NBC_00315]|uniref:hypothetical protein n=1 Tax=Kitasatospora sp. NBC_00315 TaxID=2975963 RepID=UPI0032502786